MTSSSDTLPTRYRHPIEHPDPVLAEPYRALFGGRVPGPRPGMVDRLAAALMEADPLADAWLVTARELDRTLGLTRAGAVASNAAALLEEASLHGIDSLPDPPAQLVALFRQLEHVPTWLDPEKLTMGARAYRRTGALGHFVLGDFGLMGGYRSAAVAKTLMSTGRLAFAAAERLINTGRFVTAATEPGEILPGRSGYAFTIRVRMVHAMVRAGLLRGDWDVARWGVPINQSDTLGTNLLFSMGMVLGCKRWGLRFTHREVDAIVHLWRYVGYLIGIDEQLLPADEESAQSALYLVGVSQPDPDEDSRALAKALYEVPLTFERPAWVKRIIAREVELRLAMTRQILGDAACDQLGLPQSGLGWLLPGVRRVIGSVERVRERVPGGNALAFRAGDWVIKRGQQLLDAELAKETQARREAVPSGRVAVVSA